MDFPPWLSSGVQLCTSTKLADQEQSLGFFYVPCPSPISSGRFVAFQTALPRIAPRLNSVTFHHPVDQMPDEMWLKEGRLYFISRWEGTQRHPYFSRLVAPLSCEVAPLELRVSLPIVNPPWKRPHRLAQPCVFLVIVNALKLTVKIHRHNAHEKLGQEECVGRKKPNQTKQSRERDD